MPSMGEERRGEAMQQREPQADAAAGDAATARDGAAEVRLDVWLWAARFFRTRSLAKQAIEAARIEVNTARAKPSRTLRGGETLRIERAGELFEVAVLGLSDVRGPASVAQKLYAETEASRTRGVVVGAQRSAERAGYSPPETRPDKRARRLIRALGDIDAA
jgi:ribosome-associated heat shock protein Hsp15